MSSVQSRTIFGDSDAILFSTSRIVSLLDMLRFYANRFANLGRYLGQIEAALEIYQKTGESSLGKPCEADLLATMASLTELMGDVCNHIGLEGAIDQLTRISVISKMPLTTLGELLHLFTDLQNRVEDELNRRLFFAMSADEGRRYEDSFPFGESVNQKFSKCAFDISEAAKSLACGRSTACVFHCMRVLEVGLHFVAAKLKVKVDDEKNWGTIINELTKAVTALLDKPKHAKQKKAYMSGATSYLYHVKTAWRNPVMHVRGKYTPEEAENILNAVRGFMQYLAGPVRKKKIPQSIGALGLGITGLGIGSGG
jgi:hypothetical protein